MICLTCLHKANVVGTSLYGCEHPIMQNADSLGERMTHVTANVRSMPHPPNAVKITISPPGENIIEVCVELEGEAIVILPEGTSDWPFQYVAELVKSCSAHLGNTDRVVRTNFEICRGDR